MGGVCEEEGVIPAGSGATQKRISPCTACTGMRARNKGTSSGGRGSSMGGDFKKFFLGLLYIKLQSTTHGK